MVLGVSLLTDIKNVAKPGETSLGISDQKVERQDPLVEPALREAMRASRKEETAELVLPSGLPTGSPQTNPNLVDGVESREEITFLIQLYAAKYGVGNQILEQIVECESRYDPEATGRDEERGLAQFLHSTWLNTPQARFGWDSAYHPAVNIEAAAWMLSKGRIEEFHAIPCS